MNDEAVDKKLVTLSTSSRLFSSEIMATLRGSLTRSGFSVLKLKPNTFVFSKNPSRFFASSGKKTTHFEYTLIASQDEKFFY